METVKIVISLPPKCLSPNARVHWGQRSKANKEHRTEAAFNMDVGLLDTQLGGDWSTTTIKPVFFFNTKHKRDRDNCSAMLKAARDGIADAMIRHGLVKDDSGFIPLPAALDYDKHLPRVEIIISARPDLGHRLDPADSLWTREEQGLV